MEQIINNFCFSLQFRWTYRCPIAIYAHFLDTGTKSSQFIRWWFHRLFLYFSIYSVHHVHTTEYTKDVGLCTKPSSQQTGWRILWARTGTVQMKMCRNNVEMSRRKTILDIFIICVLYTYIYWHIIWCLYIQFVAVSFVFLWYAIKDVFFWK